MKAGWETKRIGDICIIKPPKKEARAKLKQDDIVSFLPMEDLFFDKMIASPVKKKQFGEVVGSYTYFSENDILLAKITPCFENGKLGIARLLLNQTGFGSSEYIVLRACENITPEFLYFFLSQEKFRKEGAERMAGAVGHKRLPVEFVENYLIPCPPLSEQRRIVAILEEAFAGIAAAKEKAEQNLKNAKEVFEAYSKSIFSLQKADWKQKTIDKIAENLDNKRIPITKNKRKAGNIPYYGASGIVDYVEDYIFDDDLLCISEDGANLLARTYPIAFSISGKTWVNNHAHVLRFKNIETQKFVEMYVNSINIEEYVNGMAQPKLNQAMLNKITVPFPPLNEQKIIVSQLNELSNETSSLESTYQQKISDLEELKKSVLQQAFSGAL